MAVGPWVPVPAVPPRQAASPRGQVCEWGCGCGCHSEDHIQTMVDKHARIHRHTQTGRQTHTHTHTHISEKIRHQTYTQIYSYTQRNSIFCCESENLITPSVLSSVCLLFHLLIAGVSLYRSIALSLCLSADIHAVRNWTACVPFLFCGDSSFWRISLCPPLSYSHTQAVDQKTHSIQKLSGRPLHSI